MVETFLSFFTDEPDVIFTLKKDFPTYNWISNTTKAQNSILENRYSMESYIIISMFKHFLIPDKVQAEELL